MNGSPVTKKCTLENTKKLPDFITKSLVSQRISPKKLPSLLMYPYGNTKLNYRMNGTASSGLSPLRRLWVSAGRLLRAFTLGLRHLKINSAIVWELRQAAKLEPEIISYRAIFRLLPLHVNEIVGATSTSQFCNQLVKARSNELNSFHT